VNRNRFLLLLAFAALAAPKLAFAQEGPPIWGFVISNSRGPIQGVTVSLVHPVLGRSSPSFSQQNGYYFFNNIPPRQEPYYIEAYWGQELLFRSLIYYRGGSIRFNIQLP
jgi:hypothetical protein